jgi:hypothetical protein
MTSIESDGYGAAAILVAAGVRLSLRASCGGVVRLYRATVCTMLPTGRVVVTGTLTSFNMASS